MQLEIGTIVEGTVTGLTNFGAFVSLPDGKSGMVHISEVSTEFVKDIREHLSEGQQVRVKIISIGDDGKIGLSIRKANEENQPQKPHKPRGNRPPNVWQGQQKHASNEKMSFEDMMAKFKQESDEKMSAFKKSSDSRYSVSRRGNSNKK
ncbi:MAG: S1 RNA-binding domain-containing protein [Acutalibacteraceae bacterium]|nr:S1 RNA-binding domain-containing protein [Oscillospiraceae bacterium]